MNVLEKVREAIRTDQLFEPGDGIVVAVSGGSDSVALLHILFVLSGEWNWKLSVAHVNHQFRIQESEREAEFVRQLCRQLGVPCDVGVIDVPAHIKASGANAQAAARELRYAFLHAAASRAGASRIALAHHADDQAETVLMRLLRGTGPSGLSGMPIRRREKNVELVRPCLRIYKSELLTYCEEQGLSFCEDSSNRERKYVRNRIRLDLMPELCTYNEKFPQSLNRLSEVMAAEDDYLDRVAAQLADDHVKAGDGFRRFSRIWFCGLHIALQRRFVKLILSYLACGEDLTDFVKIERVREAIVQTEKPNIREEIDGRISLTREYDRISLHTMMLPTGTYARIIKPGDKAVHIPEAGVSIVCEWTEVAPGGTYRALQQDEVALDADLLSYPLTVRSRKDGDRMEPLGLNGSKKVKDMFIDDKVAPSVRAYIPIVTDSEGRLLWIAGLRRSRHAVVTDATRRILHMKASHARKDE